MKTRLEHRYPWLDDRSTWHERWQRGVEHPDPAGVGPGGRVVGNGHVFAVAQGEPITRLHAILGPDYGRDAVFDGWGAQTVTLQQGGVEVDWSRFEAFRIRRTGIVGVDLHAPGVRMLLVDCAPPDWPVLLRTLVVMNIGEQPLSDLRLVVRHTGLPDALTEHMPDGLLAVVGDRRLHVVGMPGQVTAVDNGFSMDVPSLVPGEDAMVQVALITGRDALEMAALTEKVRRDADALPGAAYHWWQDWMRDTALVAGDDMRVCDLVDDAKVLVAVQQGPGGVVAPLVERSTSTAIDEDAPMRWLLLSGKYDAVRRALSARYSATCRRGAYATALPAQLPAVESAPVEPDWPRLTPPSAWTAGVIVRLHWAYIQQTGDLELLKRHYRYLRWLVEAQPVSRDGLLPCGHDEPFYHDFQLQLPAGMRDHLIPDAAGYDVMRPAPWGAAAGMALVGAAERLAVVAQKLGQRDDVHRLGVLAARVREATERTYWLDEQGFYAAAKSRVDGRRFTTPHLPTALAPFITDYAFGEPERARHGLDEVLQYCLDTTGLPLVTPDVEAFPGLLPGALLATMTQLDMRSTDLVYLAQLSMASPAGEFRSLYTPVTMDARTDGVADPAMTATSLLGILTYLLAVQETDAVIEVAPHLPPGMTHLHVEGVREAGHRVELVVRRPNGGQHVQIGNAGPGTLRVRFRHHALPDDDATYYLPPGEHIARVMPREVIDSSLLPAPRDFTPEPVHLSAAPLLIVTVDPDSFKPWKDLYRAQILDPSFPLTPQDLGQMLVGDDNRRRYDALYLDVPETGAAWAGLPAAFWQHEALTTALERYRDLGGIITGTLFMDRWQVAVDGRYLGTVVSRHGWVTLLHDARVAFAETLIPWESSQPEEVALLLYIANSTELDLAVNGEIIWRSERREGHRAVIPALFQPGENRVTFHARHRDNGFGFSLGIRQALRWNTQVGGIEEAA